MDRDTEKAVNKFQNDMKNIIATWKGYETSFYTKNILPIGQTDIFLSRLLDGGQPRFPHNLYVMWTSGSGADITGFANGVNRSYTITELERWMQKHGDKYICYLRNDNNMEAIKKGDALELKMADLATKGKAMNKLAEALSGSLKYVGPEHKREDFVLTEEFSLDIKYSGLKGDDRFNNIIKDFGASQIGSIQALELNILRSLYTEGASEGLFNPKATGQTKHLGILKRDKKTGQFQEITQEDYIKAYEETGRKEFKKPIPSLRKEIIYLFDNDGYWASVCLETITSWASKRLRELSFTENTRSENYRSVAQEDFWKRPWYAKGH